MKTRVDKSICPCFFESLDTEKIPSRDPDGPFRMTIIDVSKDMETAVIGIVESGTISVGDNLLVMPNEDVVKVLAIYRDEDIVEFAKPGDNIVVILSGIEEVDLSSGFVLSCTAKVIPAVYEFDAQLQILELLDNAIFTEGYKAVLHIHAAVIECEIVKLHQEIDLKTKKPKKNQPVLFVKNGGVVLCRFQVNNLICIEKFADFPQLGSFTLETQGKTVAVGWVTSLVTEADNA